MPWTVNSEIHPLWARGVSSSVSTSCHWAFNLLVSLTFLTLVENLTAKGTHPPPTHTHCKLQCVPSTQL